MEKVCVVCQLSKPIDEFYIAKKTGDIYRRCKGCESIRAKEYKKSVNYKITDNRKQKRNQWSQAVLKACSTCNIEKSSSEFEPRRKQCNDCRKKYLAKYHAQDHVKQRVNQNFKNLKQKNPQALVKSRLRSRLLGLIRKFKGTKQHTLFELVVHGKI